MRRLWLTAKDHGIVLPENLQEFNSVKFFILPDIFSNAIINTWTWALAHLLWPFLYIILNMCKQLP